MSREKRQNDWDKQYFDTEHLKSDLKGRSLRSASVTLLSQCFKFCFRLGSTAILARLLSPGDYGLLGMATVIIGFVELFKDLGLSAATIQKDKINHQQVSTLFWVNLGISCLIAMIVAGCSPIFAWFYHEPRLKLITFVLSSNFILGGLTVQHQALMMRQMQFAGLAKIDIISMIVSITASIISAWLGAGYWALVILQSANAITIAILSWITCKWRPGCPSRKAEIREMLIFGGNLTGFRTLNYFSRNLDNILIGRVWGATQLGLYAKAYELVLLPARQINAPINSVAMPTLSSLQNDPERYRKYYYKGILLITSIGMPIVGFMYASVDQLILILLGEEWLDVIPLFKYLIPVAYVGSFNVATGWVYQSLGKTDKQLKWGIIGSALNAIIFFISVQWGAIGVAATYGLTRPLFFLPSHAYCFKNTPIRLSKFIVVLLRPMLSSVISAGVVIYLNSSNVIHYNIIIQLIGNIIIYLAFYFMTWLFLPNGKKDFSDIYLLLKDIRKPNSKI